MRVVFVSNYYMPYSKEDKSVKSYYANSGVQLCENLVKKGCEVVVYSRNISAKRREVVNGVLVNRLPVPQVPVLRFFLWVVLCFFCLFRRSNCVFLCWDWSSALPVVLASFFNRCFVFCSLRGKPQGCWLERLVVRHCSLIFSSEWVKSKFEVLYGVNGVVLHHGVDVSLFDSGKYGGKSVLLNKCFRVCYVGRVVKGKGLEELADIVSGVPDFSLVVVGDGDVEVKSYVRNKLGGRVFFSGFMGSDGVADLVSKCDVVVLLSESEGFSSVVLEAMSLGKVFVGTPVGGVPEVVENGVDGFIVKDREECLRVLLELRDNVGLREKIGLRAREKVLNCYDWNIYIEKWISCLRNRCL